MIEPASVKIKPHHLDRLAIVYVRQSQSHRVCLRVVVARDVAARGIAQTLHVGVLK
jgi:hypothetical protein